MTARGRISCSRSRAGASDTLRASVGSGLVSWLHRGVPPDARVASRANQLLVIAAVTSALWLSGAVALGLVTDPAALHGPGPPREDASGIDPFPWSTEALRARLADEERLAPDGRFVRAFDAAAFMAGRRAATTVARWTGDHWELSRAARAFSALPEEATPEDALAALVAHGELPRVSNAEAPVPAHVLDVAPGTAIAALRLLDVRSNPSPAAAARLLASVLFETPDRFDDDDLLAAHALAAAAWARVAGQPAPDAEVLLTWSLGYPAAARRLAVALAPTDPLRAFVEGDDARLIALNDPREGARYLWFRRLVSRREAAAAVAWTAQASPAVAAAVGVIGFIPDAFEGSAAVPVLTSTPARVHAALRGELGEEVVAPGEADGALLAAGAEMPRSAGPSGRFLDAAWVTQRLRATLWSATAAAVLRRADEAQDLAGARSERAAAGDGGAAFGPRLAALDALVSGDRRALLRTMGAAEVPALLRMAAARRLGPLHGVRAVRPLVRAIDARPGHVAGLAAELLDEGFDLPWMRRACARVLAEPSGPVPVVETCRSRERAASAAPEPLPTAADEARWIADEAASPDDWTRARAPHFAWLVASSRVAESDALARTFVATHPLGAASVRARSDLAASLVARGDAAGAWAVLEPAVASLDGPAMAVGIDVLRALRRNVEALDLAVRWARYEPGARTAAAVAEIRWAAGDDDGAAQALRDAAAGAGSEWLRYVVPAFVRSVAASPERAAAATAGLARAAIEVPRLLPLTRALDDAGATRAARAALSSVAAPGGEAALAAAVEAHRADVVRGAPSADADFDGAAGGAREAALPLAFAAGDDALVWHLGGASPTSDASLFEAAALRRGAPDDARRGRVTATLGRRTDLASRLASLVLCVGALDAARTLAATPRLRSRTAYWVGFRAACEGRGDDAREWWRFVARHGDDGAPEAAWARAALWAQSARGAWGTPTRDTWTVAPSTPVARPTAPVAVPAAVPAAPTEPAPAPDARVRHHHGRDAGGAEDGVHRHHHGGGSRGASGHGGGT